MSNIHRTSIADEIFYLIQEKIHKGEFPAGYRFPPQKRMAEEYGVSVSTIREAIGKLTLLGYVSAKQGVGTRVENTSGTGAIGQYMFLHSSEVVHFLEARLCLEKSAIRLAVYMATEADVARLGDIIRQQEQAASSGDSSRFSDYDKAFHKELMVIGGNPILLQLMEVIQKALFDFIEEITSFESVKCSAVCYHKRILAHIEEGDVLAAEKAMVEHLWEAIKLTGSTLSANKELEEVFGREIRIYNSLIPDGGLC